MSCQSVCLWRLRAIARMKSDLDAIRVPLILEINGAVSFRSLVDLMESWLKQIFIRFWSRCIIRSLYFPRLVIFKDR